MKKRYKILLGILGGVLIFWAGGWTQEKFNRGADLFNQHHLEEGLKRYAPTRIEWLALKLNLDNHYFDYDSDDSLNVRGYMILYSGSGSDLLVTIHYKHNVKYESIKDAVTHVRVRVFNQAQYYGWDAWVKVRLEFHKIPEPNLDIKARRKVYDSNPTEVYEWKGREEPKLIKSD